MAAQMTRNFKAMYSALRRSAVAGECLPTFAEFEEKVVQQKQLTVRDFWGKVLTSVPGEGVWAATAIHIACYRKQLYRSSRKLPWLMGPGVMTMKDDGDSGGGGAAAGGDDDFDDGDDDGGGGGDGDDDVVMVMMMVMMMW